MAILTLQGLLPTQTGHIVQLVNSRYCVLALCTLAVLHIVLVSIYYRESINCFCPAHSTGPQCRMMETHCLTGKDEPLWLNVEYYVHHSNIQHFNMPVYYQYTSLILFLLASLFYIPTLIWRELCRACGVLPDELALNAIETRRIKDSDEQDSGVKELASYVHTFCTRQLYRRHLSYCFRWLHGNKLTLSRILAGSLYALNVIGQFYILDALLGMKFHELGWEMLRSLPPYLPGYPFNIFSEELLGFPELVEQNHTSLTWNQTILCDVMVRQLGNLQRYTIQCVLPINSLNELVYTYVWFLLLGTGIVTLTSLVLFVFRFLTFPCQKMNIRERLQDLRALNREDSDDMAAVCTFESEYLHRDGLLLLGYIEAGAGDVITDRILQQLWDVYQAELTELEILTKATKWQETILEDTDEVPSCDPEIPPQILEMEPPPEYTAMIAQPGHVQQADSKEDLEFDPSWRMKISNEELDDGTNV